MYKERNGWGNQHSAHVKYDVAQELDVSAAIYGGLTRASACGGIRRYGLQ
jgi:hypothetical protein